jgi:hypothetical protein
MVVPALAHLRSRHPWFGIGSSAVADDENQREEIRALLTGGLVTEIPRADTHEGASHHGTPARRGWRPEAKARDQASRGPIMHDGIEQACETCMFQGHRRYCELPEFELAVEPEWSCRLWRI